MVRILRVSDHYNYDNCNIIVIIIGWLENVRKNTHHFILDISDLNLRDSEGSLAVGSKLAIDHSSY